MPEEQQERQQHPIESLMKTAMETIKEMVDVNTVVGSPVETPDGTVIVPVCRVACGFGAGGGEIEAQAPENEQFPFFGGGSGAGMSVQPVGFLVVGQGQIRFLPIDGNVLADRLIDLAPQLLSQLQSLFKRGEQKQAASTVPAAPPPGGTRAVF